MKHKILTGNLLVKFFIVYLPPSYNRVPTPPLNNAARRDLFQVFQAKKFTVVEQ
jgi:hypothetical protein